MSEQYERILRIRPVIMANGDLMQAFTDCFDHFYKHTSFCKPELRFTKGRQRTIYTNLKPINDPANDEELFLALKLGVAAPMYYGILDSRRPYSTWLSNEIGALESYPPPDGPRILGVVVHFGYNVAGLLTEDFSAGGRFKIIPIDHGDATGDFLQVETSNGERVVRSDAKRESGYHDRGRKYFAEAARIDLGL
jgi:hypothetical protein